MLRPARSRGKDAGTGSKNVLLPVYTPLPKGRTRPPGGQDRGTAGWRIKQPPQTLRGAHPRFLSPHTAPVPAADRAYRTWLSFPPERGGWKHLKSPSSVRSPCPPLPEASGKIPVFSLRPHTGTRRRGQPGRPSAVPSTDSGPPAEGRDPSLQSESGSADVCSSPGGNRPLPRGLPPPPDPKGWKWNLHRLFHRPTWSPGGQRLWKDLPQRKGPGSDGCTFEDGCV